MHQGTNGPFAKECLLFIFCSSFPTAVQVHQAPGKHRPKARCSKLATRCFESFSAAHIMPFVHFFRHLGVRKPDMTPWLGIDHDFFLASGNETWQAGSYPTKWRYGWEDHRGIFHCHVCWWKCITCILPSPICHWLKHIKTIGITENVVQDQWPGNCGNLGLCSQGKPIAYNRALGGTLW